MSPVGCKDPGAQGLEIDVPISEGVHHTYSARFCLFRRSESILDASGEASIFWTCCIPEIRRMRSPRRAPLSKAPGCARTKATSAPCVTRGRTSGRTSPWAVSPICGTERDRSWENACVGHEFKAHTPTARSSQYSLVGTYRSAVAERCGTISPSR